MNILGYLQKIGRALMVPVATLPAAAIMMGIGYWIDPTGWGTGSATAALLIKAGAAIIDNMSILFAVGVAYGMSKDKDGAAALAGLVIEDLRRHHDLVRLVAGDEFFHPALHGFWRSHHRC